MLAPTGAAITLDPTGGGISAVAHLLWRVIREEWGPRAQLLTMFGHPNRPATFIEKARFTAALSSAQLLGRTDFILFTHLALAKIHKAVPERVRRRYGVFLHGIEAWEPLSASERDTLARAELRIANSHYTAARVAEAHPGIGPVVACPLGLPLSPGSSDDAALPWRFGPHAVVTVGRMDRTERYKGHDPLIEAWPRVVAAVPDAQLVLVGDGDDAPRLRQKAALTCGTDRILFTGFVPRSMLDALYRHAALFALPSRAEGFGLVYLEAMAHRLPCVGSIHDAARDVIVDRQTGRLVDLDERNCLAETLAGLLLDEDRRRQMGNAGYCRLRSEFDFDRFKHRVCSLLGANPRAAASIAV